MPDRRWHAPLTAAELRLVAATAAAIGGAGAVRLGGPIALLAVAAVALAAALALRRASPWYLALPGALAAYAPLPAVAPLPRAGPVRVHGVVAERMVVDAARDEARCRVRSGPNVVLCVFAAQVRLAPGDAIEAVGRLQLATDPARTATVAVPARGLRRHQPARSLAAWADALRLRLLDGLVAHVHGRAGRLCALLVLGRCGDVDPALADAHRATGLSHLLAVSGAHISLLATLLLLLAGGHRHRRGVRIAGAAVLATYGVLTGLDPPVFRALVAFALLGLGLPRGRAPSVVACLTVPALLTALWSPADLGSASFLLSYAAVFGLGLAGTGSAHGSAWRWLWLGVRASFWASLTTMPLTLGLFGQVAPWTVLATPLLGPLVALLLALGLGVATLDALGSAGAAWGALPLRGLTEVYIFAVEQCARLPGAPILATTDPPAALLAVSGGLGLALVLWHRTRAAVAAMCTLLAIPFFLPLARGATPGLELLDVGHGQACILRLPGGAVAVVDCGSLADSRRATRAVEAALRPARRVDLLVLSHDDADHTGGAASLLRRVRVRAVAMPAELARGELGTAAARSGARIVGLPPGASALPLPGLELMRPDPATGGDNDRGLWVRADLGSFTALLPGDAEEPGVHAWLAAHAGAGADVLVLPHHGHAHGALAGLLDACRPHLGLVSGGDPGQRTPQARSAARTGVTVLETAHVGDIRVEATHPPSIHTGRPLPLLR